MNLETDEYPWTKMHKEWIKWQTLEKQEHKMQNWTLEIILNSKLEIWVGSNLLRRALTADSCKNGDGLCASRRLITPSIASWDDEDDDDRDSIRSSVMKENLKLNMIWVWL